MATKDPDQNVTTEATPAQVDPVNELRWLTKLQKERLTIDSETEKKINKLLPTMTQEVRAHAEVLKALVAANTSELPTQEDLEPDGRPMDTLRDVRRALKFIMRRIENKTIDYKLGHTLIIGLNSLGNMLIDARDSKWTKRAALLWQEREKMKALHKGQTIDVTPQLPAGEPEQEH